MKRIQCGLLIWLLLVQTGAAAVNLPAPHAEYIKVLWSGFHVGSLIVGWHQRKDGLTEMRVVVRTYGLARKVSRYQSDSTSLSKNGVPVEFHTNFSHRKSRREIRLSWDKFALMREYNQPPEKEGKRTPVSAKMKKGAYDPLTAFFAARAKVMAGKKKFTVPMYDGRRRSQLQFEVAGKQDDGNVLVKMREIFLAGFTQREQEERAQRNITINIYLDPKTYLPVGGMGQSPIGTAVGVLGANCKTIEECLARDDD